MTWVSHSVTNSQCGAPPTVVVMFECVEILNINQLTFPVTLSVPTLVAGWNGCIREEDYPELPSGIEPDPLLSQCAPYTKGVPYRLPPFLHHNSCAITCQSAYPHSLGQWQLCAKTNLSSGKSPPLKHQQSSASDTEIHPHSSRRYRPAIG